MTVIDQHISYNDYLRLLGLLQLVKEQRRTLDQLTESVANLVRVEPDEYGYYGHVDDAIWNDYSARELLKKLGLAVEVNGHMARLEQTK